MFLTVATFDQDWRVHSTGRSRGSFTPKSPMETLRSRLHGTTWRCLLIYLIALCSPYRVHAQNTAGCVGPADLERAIASHPSADAYNALGAAFGRKREFPCAISAFQSALHLDPKEWQAHYNLALALISTGNSERAYRELLTASHEYPAAVQPHLGLGSLLLQLDHPDAAILQFQMVLQLHPKSIAALDGLSKALVAEKRYAEAVQALQDAPPSARLSLDLAIAYSKSGQLQQATDLLSALVKSNPTNAAAHLRLGLILTQQQHYHRAERAFQQALRLDPRDDVSRIAEVKVLIILKQYTAALPIIQEYLHRKPEAFDALELAGEVEEGLGNYSVAEPLLKRAVSINGDQYNARYFLGVVLSRLNRPSQARVQLERALQLNPGASEALFQLAMVLRSEGLRKKSLQELNILQQKKKVAFEQQMESTQINEASESFEEGNIPKAVDLFQQSLKLDPTNSHIYYDLALAFRRQKEYLEEKQALAKAIQLDPTFPQAHNDNGVLEMQQGQMAEAEIEFKTAIVLDPEYAEAESNLGVVESRLGKIKEAEALFRKATEAKPQYVEAFVNLGLILASEGRFSESDKVLQHALQIDPDSSLARKARDMVLAQMKQGEQTTR